MSEMNDTPMIELCGAALDMAMIPKAKVGDRVRVSFEGVIVKTEQELEDGAVESCVTVQLDTISAKTGMNMRAIANKMYEAPEGEE